MPWLRDNDVHVGIINESDVIFGKFDVAEDYILINHILLLGKYYIYYRECHNSLLHLEVLLLGQDAFSVSSSILPGRKINFFFIFKSGRS